MKPFFLVVLFIIGINFYADSQEYDPYTYQDIKKKPVLSEKVFFGGGFGLQFGTFTVIKFTPEIGYRVHENVELGVGGYYMFTKNYLYNFSDHIYGIKGFARLFVYQNFYLQGEYEVLNIADFDYNTGYYIDRRIKLHSVLGGVGYRQKIGERSAVLTTILYNFSMNEKTPYGNPIFRISFIF